MVLGGLPLLFVEDFSTEDDSTKSSKMSVDVKSESKEEKS